MTNINITNIHKSVGHNPEFYYIIDLYSGYCLSHDLSWTLDFIHTMCKTFEEAEYLLKRWNHFDRLGKNSMVEKPTPWREDRYSYDYYDINL
jgi:hypothetical protein